MQPLLKVTLVHQVTELIQQQIFRGELEPGERLVEYLLARHYGVGQNVVREALLDLSHRGLVRRETNKGTYVTRLTLEEARKIAEVRGAIEVLAVELASKRIRAKEVDPGSLQAIVTEMEAAAKACDRQGFYEQDVRFHRALWNMSGNEYLERLLEQVVIPLFGSFILLFFRTDGARKTLIEGARAHRALADALIASPSAAKKAIAEMVNLSLVHNKGLLKALPSEQPRKFAAASVMSSK
jgi:DNA-binding GntR family transcriptional regulator